MSRQLVEQIIRRAVNPRASVALHNRRQILTDGASLIVIRRQDCWPLNLPAAEDCQRLSDAVDRRLDRSQYALAFEVSAEEDIQINRRDGVVSLTRPPADHTAIRRIGGVTALVDGTMVTPLWAWEAVHQLAYRQNLRWFLSCSTSHNRSSGRKRLSAIGLDERDCVVAWLRGL